MIIVNAQPSHLASAQQQPVFRRVRATNQSEDARRLFVAELEVKAGLSDIRSFFERFGDVKVKNVRLLTDPITQCSKGMAFVELWNSGDLAKACKMHGEKFRYPKGNVSYPINVKILQPWNIPDDEETYINNKHMRTITVTNLDPRLGQVKCVGGYGCVSGWVGR